MCDQTKGISIPGLRDVWHMLGLERDAEVGMHRCPGHADRKASLSVFIGRDGRGLRWKCHAGCGGGDGVDLYAMMKRCSRRTAIRMLAGEAGAAVEGLCDAIARRTRDAVGKERPLPRFRFRVIGTDARIARLSEQRSIPLEAVALANRRGLLAFGNHDGRACWAVLDSTRLNIQLRRLSGEAWSGEAKSHTLWNSRAALPIGLAEAAEAKVVHVVEGAPDLVAAHAIFLRMTEPGSHAAVALLGAGMRPSKAVLGPLKGKDIIIWAHSDTAGATAAEAWTRTLLGLARSVATARPGEILPGSKDLNDLVASPKGLRAALAWMSEVGHA